MLINHLYIFLKEILIQVLYPFLNWIICFLLSSRSSLYTLDILYQIYALQIFSPSLCFFLFSLLCVLKLAMIGMIYSTLIGRLLQIRTLFYVDYMSILKERNGERLITQIKLCVMSVALQL